MQVRTRVVLTAVTVLAVVASMVAPAAAASWHFGTLDGSATADGRVNGDVGQYTSTLLFESTPHTFYRDADNGTLRHAWWIGTKWAFQTLDGGDTSKNLSHSGGDVGTDAKAVMFGGQPHVFYYDVTNGNLKHAWWTGTQWAFQILDGSGSSVSGQSADTGTDISVLSYGAGPHLFYYDVTRHSLRHAWWTGAQWGFQTLDGSQGISGSGNDVGQYTSALLYGTPHVFYYDDTDTVLRHAWWTGTQWGFQTVDGLGSLPGQVNASVGSDTTAAMFGGTPHVWYYDISNGDLRHAWWTGSTWAYQTLDGAGGNDVGTYNVVSMYGGTPHVFYRDETNGNLRQAWWNGSSWILETLDGSGSGASSQTEGDVGLDVSTTVYQGQLQAIYYDAGSGNLRQAWFG